MSWPFRCFEDFFSKRLFWRKRSGESREGCFSLTDLSVSLLVISEACCVIM